MAEPVGNFNATYLVVAGGGGGGQRGGGGAGGFRLFLVSHLLHLQIIQSL